MKSLLQQIEFVDKIMLPIYGINGVNDFETQLNIKKFDKIPKLLNKLNDIMNNFKTIFPTKRFNLYKTNYHIDTYNNAFNFLKKCLEITAVQFSITKQNGDKILRLETPNILLYNYRMKKDINMQKNTNESKIVDPEKYVSGKKIIERIKRTIKYYFTVDFEKLHKDGSKIIVDLRHYGLENKAIKSIKLNFVTKYNGNKPILTNEYIDTLLDKTEYCIEVGGVIIYSSSFKNGYNIIPDGMLLLNDLLYYHETKLRIQNIDKLENVAKYIECMFTVDHVEFNKKINKIVDIEFNKKRGIEFKIYKEKLINLFRIKGGMGGIAFTTFISNDDYKKYKKTNIVPVQKALPENDNKTYDIIDDKMMYIHHQHITTDTTDALQSLTKHNDAMFSIFYRDQEQIIPEIYRTIEKKRIEHYKITLMRYSDLVRIFNVNVSSKLNMNNLHIKLCVGKQECELPFENKQNGSDMSLDFKDTFHNFLLHPYHETSIKIEYVNEENIDNVFENIHISYEHILACDKLRNLFAKYDFFDGITFEQLINTKLWPEEIRDEFVMTNK